MSTRSNIGIEREKGIVESVYCHFDGYPEGVGVMLKEHYTDRAKVEKLISLGNMSCLEEKIEPTLETHSFDNPEDNVCVFYGRDRGETDQESEKCKKLLYPASGNFSGAEYVYLFTLDGRWVYSEVPEYGFMDL